MENQYTQGSGASVQRDGMLCQYQWQNHTRIYQVGVICISMVTLLMYFACYIFIDLIAKTMNRKHLDADVVQATAGIKSATAITIFPNVASTPAVPTEQLLAQHVSRMTMSHAQI